MTTLKTLLGQCIILLGIFVCNVHPWDEKDGDINCELYPFHLTCRGAMSKRIPRHGGDEHKSDQRASSLEKRLWISLLNIMDDSGDYYPIEQPRVSQHDWNSEMADVYQLEMKDPYVADTDKLETGY